MKVAYRKACGFAAAAPYGQTVIDNNQRRTEVQRSGLHRRRARDAPVVKIGGNRTFVDPCARDGKIRSGLRRGRKNDPHNGNRIIVVDVVVGAYRHLEKLVGGGETRTEGGAPHPGRNRAAGDQVGGGIAFYGELTGIKSAKVGAHQIVNLLVVGIIDKLEGERRRFT